MKKYFLFFLFLLLSMAMRAATVDVKSNLWSGVQAMDAGWSNWIPVPASAFSAAETGNVISVHVSAISAGSALVMLNTGTWKPMPGAEEGKAVADAPCEMRWEVTDAMLAELKAHGLIVKGVSYTATSVDLIRKVQTSDEVKGNPATTVWTGRKVIDWSGALPDGWLKLDRTLFEEVKVGDRLRFNYAGLAIGATARISTGDWKEMPDGAGYRQLSSSCFEYAVTAGMLARLKAGGCIVSGIGFTLTGVEVIDPKQIPALVCQVDRRDIRCWEKGEAPVIHVGIQSLESRPQDVTVEVLLRTDGYEDLRTERRQVTVDAGKTQDAAVSLGELAPGFYHAVVRANYGELADFNIGYDPTGIVSASDAQPDFMAFWDKAKADLAKVAPAYKLTRIAEKSTASRNVYLVEMQSVDDGDGKPVTIRGYYAEPVAEGTYPVLITQNGYDSDAKIPALDFCPAGGQNSGWIELNLSVRGQVINNRGENVNRYGDWFAYHFGDKDTYYYRGAYMDVVRGIDFIASRRKARQDAIFMMGGSQGGAFTIAGAALDRRIKAIAPSIQFMGDFPDYFKVGAWPASVARKQQKALGMSDEDMYRFLSYFDTKNLAPYITCPVKTAMGLQDPICPPHTNFAPYNNLKVADRQYVVNAECRHETPSAWYGDCLEFFKAHLTDNTEYAEVGLDIWKGSLSVDDWNTYRQIAPGRFAPVRTGDELRITIPALKGKSHLLMLQNGDWKTLAGLEDKYVLTEAPCTFRTTVTADMLAELQAKGLIVKGTGYVLSRVGILHRVPKGNSGNKGNALTNLWTGCEPISWSGAHKNSVWLEPADIQTKWAGVKPGHRLRMSCSGLGIGTAQGKILANYTALPGLATARFSDGGYFEYTLTGEWIARIRKEGLRVTGTGFTLTAVDLIDPDREYSLVAQCDDEDIKAWEPHETPKLGMTITNLETVPVKVPYKVTLTKDMVDKDTQTHSVYKTYVQEVTLGAGETRHVDQPFDGLDEPGFYRMTASVDNNTVCSYNIGYAPRRVPVKATAPADFWDYWKEGLQELAATAPDIRMEELPGKSSAARKVYLVTMKSVPDSRGGRPVTLRGYYAEPVGEGRFPAIIHYQGTDGGTGTPWCMNADDNPGCCEFVLSTRGQMLNNREPNLADNVYGRDKTTGKTDYYSFGWGDKERHYYRGAYLDCVRAVDFMKSRAKADTCNLYAAGGSQGGCFTYVAEGLTGAFRAIAPSITGHADFEEGMRIVNWPRANFLAAKEKQGMTDDEMNTFNAYFDVMNFASRVTCPVISCFSLQDTTDPVRTNLAPFNLLDKVKEDDKVYIINPFLGHATPAGWGRRYMEFFEKHHSDRTPAAIRQTTSSTGGDTCAVCFDMTGRRVSVPGRGLYITGGRKLVMR
ncbi:acetylxylan esterase [Prevotella multiformis]|uniref:acetylxylan esterase n=1 Tax=Prevotella multiformis TaxID=282402 RepID=UPI003F9FF5B1